MSNIEETKKRYQQIIREEVDKMLKNLDAKFDAIYNENKPNSMGEIVWLYKNNMEARDDCNAPICSDCAKSKGWKPRQEVCGWWTDTCSVCGVIKPCCAYRDWIRG